MAFTKKKAARIAMFVGTVGVSAALVGAGVAGTGAYFSDSSPGSISATVGSIDISTENTTLSMSNVLPGEPATESVNFTNVGLNAQDVWVVLNQADIGDFSKATDNGLINDRGRYADVLVQSSGDRIFHSNNLNDDPVSCPPGAGDIWGSPNGDGLVHTCNPLPHMLRLRSNLAPGTSSDMRFTFTLSTAAKGTAWQGNPAFAPIRYSIVATQHGITPDNSLNTTPVL